ncbi:MAG: TetR/AcrR family transcriptional regulator [Geminicoccaceae bacterium]
MFEDRPTGEIGPDETPAADHKRRQILDGARQVFLADGFDGASMGSIARAAGVSKGTLYSYFENKEGLFERLIQEERSSLAEALFRLDADDPDTRAVLRRLGRSFLAMLIRPEHIASVRMVIGAADKLPRLGQAFYDAGPCQGVARLAAYLDRQVAADRLSIPDTEVAAQQFLDLCSGPVMKRMLFAVTPAPDQAMAEQQVERALAMFYSAYGPRKPSA